MKEFEKVLFVTNSTSECMKMVNGDLDVGVGEDLEVPKARHVAVSNDLSGSNIPLNV